MFDFGMLSDLLPSFFDSPAGTSEAVPYMNDTQKNFISLNKSTKRDVHEKGINSFAKLTSLPTLNNPENSKVIEKLDSAIILKEDSPNGPGTGLSKTGSRASCVDITCGRLSSVKDVNKNQNIFVNSSFQGDAARLYVSQLTNLDNSMDVPSVENGNPAFEERSGIAAIADNISIKGRLGVKIVTSPSGESNSLGGLISSKSGIELIANADAKNVQPIVKGDNMIEALTEIFERLDELNNVIMDIAAENIKMAVAIASHTHPVALPVLTALPSPALISPSVSSGKENLISGTIGGLKRKLNLFFNEFNYTYSLGNKYINSDYNRTN